MKFAIALAEAALSCVTLAAAEPAKPVTLQAGDPVVLETVSQLSSKTSVKGDLIDLRVIRDVIADGRVAIPAGTAAKGQIADARAKGGLGMSGRILVRPLYLETNGQIVRLRGRTTEKGSLSAGGVVGLVILTPAFSGRSAVIPAGTEVPGEIEKPVTFIPSIAR